MINHLQTREMGWANLRAQPAQPSPSERQLQIQNKSRLDTSIGSNQMKG